MVRPTINSVKHYVQHTLATTSVGTVSNIELIKGVQVVGTGATEVKAGASVKAVWIEFWIRGQDTSAGSFVCAISKNNAGSVGLTAGEMANIMDMNEKNNIFFTSQGLANHSTGDATPVYRGWLKIPKGKQRFTIGQTFNITLLAQALDINSCGIFVFKEYY